MKDIRACPDAWPQLHSLEACLLTKFRNAARS